MIAAASTGVVLLELGIVLLVLAVLGRLAARIGLPSIPLYLVAGLAMGEGSAVALDASREFLRVGADIGAVLLLLLLGLEYSTAELTAGLRRNWRGGLVDLVLNMPPGVVCGLLLGWSPLAAVLLGGATYMSSSGIIARLLDDLGRIGNRETPVVLSLLVIEDLAMAVFLPVMAVLLVGSSPLDGAVSVVVAVGAACAALAASIRWGHHLSRLVAARSNELLLLTLLGLTLVVAGLAEEVQVSAAVGAFVIGVALSGHVATAGRHLLEPLRDVFGGLFFVFFGVQVDPATLGPMVLPAAVLTVVTVVTKYGTGALTARRAQLGERARVRAGLALIARGEFSIVIAGIGVAAGTDADLGPLTACYVLMIAVVGSLLLRYSDWFAVRVAARTAARTTPRRTAVP